MDLFKHKHLVGFGTLYAIGIFQSLHRYLQLRVGNQQLAFDAREVWQPLAYEVLSGTPLYVLPAGDNKPPLFEFVNLAVGATGAYVPVFVFLIGIVNATAAVVIWVVSSSYELRKIGWLGGFLYLSSMPFVGGRYINVRSFAVIGIVFAVYFRGGLKRGAAIAVAGMFAQYSVFAIPVLAYDGYRQSEQGKNVRWIFSFVIGGLLIVMVSYGMVYAIWGFESLSNGIEWSLVAASDYVIGQDHASPWYQPLTYASLVSEVVVSIIFVLIPFAYGTLRVIEQGGWQQWRPPHLFFFLSVALSMSLLIRGTPDYWMHSLPFICLIAGLGIQDILTENGVMKRSSQS